MIKEAYVSFETAKLLKEKGFDWDCEHYYKPNGEIVRTFHTEGSHHINSSVLYEHQCLAPTQQMARRWLREEYDLHIIAYPYNANGRKKWCCKVYKAFNLLGNEKYVNETLDSCEEAVGDALKYCLTELI